MRRLINEKGFSLTELMFAMTILAIGLLAMAQMQIVALRGTTSSRQFSIATNLARETMGAVKMPGVFFEDSESGLITRMSPILENKTSANDAIGDFYWAVTNETEINDLSLAAGSRPFTFDFIEVLNEVNNIYERGCQDLDETDQPTPWPSTCAAGDIADADYVRVINTRNIPLNASDDNAIMKEINVIILWEERDRTRSVSMVTLIGRKNSAFF